MSEFIGAFLKLNAIGSLLINSFLPVLMNDFQKIAGMSLG